MKKFFILTVVVSALYSCSSKKSATTASKPSAGTNMMAVMQVDEPIPGVCDNSKVIAILPIPGNGQIKAKSPLTKEEITQKLNAEVSFLKDKPNYEDKGMVRLIVNCKGKMVSCEIDKKTQNPELDQQIVDIFSTMEDWTAGTINGKAYDTVELYSFTIKEGVISL